MVRNRNLPKLAVVYDQGSAGAVDIFLAARRICEPVFVVDRDDQSPSAPPLSASTAGSTIDITGRDRDTAVKELLAAGVVGIVTFSERQLLTTAELAEGAALPYLSVATARLCRDKLAQRRALADAGVDVVASVAVTTSAGLAAAVAEIGPPVVIKPRRGMGSTNTMRARTLREATAWAEQLERDGMPELVVEEMLVGDPSHAGPSWGDYVSVESIADGGIDGDGGVHHVAVTGKFPLVEPFREQGMIQPATLSPELEQRCRDVATGALAALGITRGVTHTELKLTATGPRVIEVNARLGGYVADILRRSCGFDLVRATLRNAVGLPVEALPAAPSGAPHRVAFQYFLPTPVDAERVVSVDGADSVTAIPGVTAFEQRLGAGDRVGWQFGTDHCLGVVSGTGASHEEVLHIVDAVLATLRVGYA